MRKKNLLRFDRVSHGLDGTWDIYHFSWNLSMGDRIQVHCDRQEQTAVLWRLLQRKLKPKEGQIEDIHQVFTYTDELLRQCLDFKKNMYDNLQSRLFEEHVWVGRRLHIHALMELLDIDIAARRIPLEQVSPVLFHRFWAIMFVATKAQLLLSNPLFAMLDPPSEAMITKWLHTFLGALVVFGEHSVQTSISWTHLYVRKDGSVEIQSPQIT